MVILGGLELVAAGVIMHQYSKNKEEERAAEEEARRRRRERKHSDERKHGRRHDSRPTAQQVGSHGPPAMATATAMNKPSRAQSAPPPRHTPQWQGPGQGPPQGQGHALSYYAGHPLSNPPQQYPPQQVPNKAGGSTWLQPPPQHNGYAPQLQAPVQPQPTLAQTQPQMQQRPRADDTFYSNPSHQTQPTRNDSQCRQNLPSKSSYERLPTHSTGVSSISQPHLSQQMPPRQQPPQPQPWQTTNPLYAELSGEPSLSANARGRDQLHTRSVSHDDDGASTRYEPSEMGDGDGHHATPPPAYQPYRP